MDGDGPRISARAAGGAMRLATLADKRAIEATPFAERCAHTDVLAAIAATAARRGRAPAFSFQLKGDAKAPLFTLSYAQLWEQVLRFANALHAAGVKPGDTVALLLPNLPETVIAHYAAQAIGAVSPINPLLEPSVIAGILQESGATVLVTLAPFAKTDIAEKAAEAVALCPSVRTVVEVDLLPYLPALMRPIAAMIRPKRVKGHGARVIGFRAASKAARGDRLAFERRIGPDTIGAYFHTGGTTGRPKLAMHAQGQMTFQGHVVSSVIFDDKDVILCALPMFHVFASYVMSLAPLMAGAHVVMLTPSGFRGEGVIANFWKLIARHRASFFCGVPTALAALDQRPIDADVSSLRYLICGSAPLPVALFERFEKNTGVKILEGYGMTEAICVSSCNPPLGERKIGSVGLPMPYVEARICEFAADGSWARDCETDRVGEICFMGPTVFAGYKDGEKSKTAFFEHPRAPGRWLKTGDLGRIDADGYIWITGRAKDLIIRGGHNIDPGMIEEALAKHPAVAFVGAVGQPDAHAGEIPCAYVELRAGATVSEEELKRFAADNVGERAARPATVTVMPELPKTAVGKTYKPALRKDAIERVFAKALADVGVVAAVEVEEDQKLGLVAVVRPEGPVDAAKIGQALNGFARPWRLGER